MKVRALAIVAVALAGAVGTTFAEAGERSDVRFSVTIGQPAFGWVQPVHDVRIVRPGVGFDRDHDGVPNRFDRVYNPRWDRDGDGVPNRRDRVYNPAWDRDGDGVPNRYDRVDNLRHDRDRDGIPDRFDRRDDRRHDRNPYHSSGR